MIQGNVAAESSTIIPRFGLNGRLACPIEASWMGHSREILTPFMGPWVAISKVKSYHNKDKALQKEATKKGSAVNIEHYAKGGSLMMKLVIERKKEKEILPIVEGG